MGETGEPDCPAPPPWGRALVARMRLCFLVSCSLWLSFPWSLTISTPLSPRLFLPVPSGVPVPAGVGWVQGHQVERHVLRFSVHPPAHPAHPQRSSDPRPRSNLGRQRRGGADGGVAPGARRVQCQAWVRLAAPTKEETAQRAGSAWSGSPREEVGVGTRTLTPATLGNHRIVSLGERLRSRQHSIDKEMVTDAEIIDRGSEDRDGDGETGGGTQRHPSGQESQTEIRGPRDTERDTHSPKHRQSD